ncbi:MAG: glycosyltransferase, partial [Candidatus Eremiobacteraeota bacterium]|nr:glycosyltransferase [Candidatus Eremiobacteraeota bacterium]
MVTSFARARSARRRLHLPATPVAVAFQRGDAAPQVSVVIPVFNGWRYTNACLRALAACDDPATAMQVVVVDDASTDRTTELLALCSGIDVVRLERNAGFAAACNAGAAAARAPFVHFLNNDTIVTPGWLRTLVDAFEDRSVGAAVSQLRFPTERVAEAGGVIWNDGRGSNYGRARSPRNWRYCSRRAVDYGSAASLMVRAAAFAQLGGFDATFAPAYYEDADLCFRLRASGLRVLYQPLSVVYHVEGASYGSNVQPEARAVQERHRHAFAAKWHAALREHFPPDPRNIERAARRLAGSPTVVVVDEHVPFTDRDAGSRRIAFLMDVFLKRGWHVIFGSRDRSEYAPYTGAL